MSPQLGSASDLAQWMNVPDYVAWSYLRRLKKLGSIVQRGGTTARPLYGLPVDEKTGDLVVKVPPDDARGKWRRYAREVLQSLDAELIGAPKP